MNATVEHIEAAKPIYPIMTAPEIELYKRTIATAGTYLEFGAGGSTIVAAQLGVPTILTVESHKGWADYVRADKRIVLRPGQSITMHHVDIGPVKEAGYPNGSLHSEKWPNYFKTIWREIDPFEIDVVLVDGRFRIACVLATLLRCRSDVTIMMHDWERSHYHVVLEFADRVALVDKLVVLRPKPIQARAAIESLLLKKQSDPT